MGSEWKKVVTDWHTPEVLSIALLLDLKTWEANTDTR
jgi:hypothetical protein